MTDLAEPLSLPAAARLLTDLIPPGSALECPRFNRDWLIRHGHLIIADVPIRAWKRAGKWYVDAAVVRQAAERLAAAAAAAESAERVPLPASSRWADRVREALANYRENPAWPTPVLGGIRVADAVDDARTIPRPYADLLRGWSRQDRALFERARVCGSCGALEPAEQPSRWREPTPDGYATTCPACLAQLVPPYAGELDGHLYSLVRPAGGSRRGAPRADGYACRICRTRRAAYWDHCHDHGFIRGPVCSGCNQAEFGWLNDPAGLRHLWHCPDCRAAATMPARQLVWIGLEYARKRERHGRCPIAPAVLRFDAQQARAELETGGAARYTVSCRAHGAEWEATVTREQLHEAAQAHIARRVPGLLT